MGLFATIVVGLIAGWLASMLMKTNTGLWKDLLFGVIGGFVGGWLSSLLTGTNFMSGINLTSILTALVGAVVVIAIYRLVTRGRTA
ncbi:GlsB/YeaQ/YmgE family stress response membrane protein [bacterium]|nr:GlsB/YeaQ/YmgE family stress response membrane protein [bacterium]